MNKSHKLISLFLTTALVLGPVGCGQKPSNEEQKQIDGQQATTPYVNTGGGFFSGFFGPFGPLGPFGFFSGRSWGTGISSGVRGTSPPNTTAPTQPNNTGVKGTSPWGLKGGSTSSSVGESGGISSGAKGGIGSSGSSSS